MVNVIMGIKGSGKTKAFIESVNNAVNEKGNVVCIANGNRHLFDIVSSVRLINYSDFSMKGYEALYGFVAGLISSNFDITHIFIDSITKMGTEDMSEIIVFIKNLDELSAKFNVEITVSISADYDNAPAELQSYCVKY